MQRPFVPLLLPLMAGIMVGYCFQLPDPALWTGLFVILPLLLLAAFLKRESAILPLVLPALFLMGILAINPYLYPDTDAGHISAFAGKEKWTIVGMIAENPQLSPGKTELKIAARAVLQSDAILPVRGNVWLTCPGQPSLAYGDVVRIKTRLRFPHNYGNPGSRDMEKRFLFRETLVRGTVGSEADLVVLRRGQGNGVKTYLEAFRSDLRTLIGEHAPSPHAQIIQASILGNQKEIPPATMELFNRTGTSHIIAISGFNIAIISAFFVLLIRGTVTFFPYLLLRFDINKWTVILTVVPVIAFTYAAGAGISVVRATIMVIAFMAALLIGRNRDLFNALAIAAFIILAIAPYSLFDVSFQLSFAAVGSILFITPILSRFLPAAVPNEQTAGRVFARKALRAVMLFLIVTAGATMGTLPLIAFYFNRLSTVVLPVNLAVVPVLGFLAIPVSTAIMAVAPVSTAAAVFLIQTATFLVDISLRIVGFFSALPWSSLPVSTPTIPEMTLYYLLLYASCRYLDTVKPAEGIVHPVGETVSRRRKFALAAVVCLVLFAADGVYLYGRDRHPGNLSVSFLDVGQGNAALIRFPAGTKMMVDGGGAPGNSFDVGKVVLAPYLHHEKIGKIHIVVFTHAHPDHMAGLIHILANFNVDEVWSNGEETATDAYRQMIKIIKDQGIRHRIVSAKAPAAVIDGVQIRFLNPPFSRSGLSGTHGDDYASANADSLVMRLTYGDTSFLLAADISGAEEAEIIRSGADIRSQVLLVPHHGSALSGTASFLAAVRPAVAVISCGRDNVFGFPHPEVTNRLRPYVTKLYRTDTNGAVTVTSDGKNLSATTYFK
jgi:competence protein ComEC